MLTVSPPYQTKTMPTEALTFPKRIQPRAIRSLADEKAMEIRHAKRIKTDKDYAFLAHKNAELTALVNKLEAENNALKRAKKGK